ncbi:MAG: hypothetical protein HC902_08860 [Calothrix sp. SM1_5_4]|nr:hypothetical protein [Calothrix sp. SM1_5_4]
MSVPPMPELPSQPARQEPKRVAVILGPGGAKAFAHVGVLKAFQQQRIPIEKVVGLEWGALVGGLYANKGQIHDVEWKLYKMEQQNLPHPKGGFFREREETFRPMEGFMADVFGKDDIGRAKVEFVCPARSVYTGVVTWQNRGAFRDAMKRCMQYPPIFKVQGSFVAGASQASEAIELLAREGYNVIILVNALGSGLPVGQAGLLDNLNSVILWQEVRRALQEASKLNVEVVNVDTSAHPAIQFEAKKELIQLGEAAGQKAASGLISKYGF